MSTKDPNEQPENIVVHGQDHDFEVKELEERELDGVAGGVGYDLKKKKVPALDSKDPRLTQYINKSSGDL